MTYGISDSGFQPKSLQDCKAELEASYRSKFGSGIDLDPAGPWGQTIGIAADRESLLWEQLEAAYDSMRPDAVTGVPQDTLYALNGVRRLPATQSSVAVTCTGTPATVIPIGRVVSTEVVGRRFTSQAAGTIVALTAWANGHTYEVDDRCTNGGNAYQCITRGTSAGSGGPTGTGEDIADNVAHWMYLGAGTGAADIVFASVDYGPVTASAGSLNVIETAVSGWSNAVNVLDATLGHNLESSSEFRARREQLLHASGNAALDAIRAAVLAVVSAAPAAPVTSCMVFENTSDTTDADGRPPHAIEVMVEGGSDADVALVIWRSKAAGISTYGVTSQIIRDAQGTERTVYFSRPEAKNIYVVVTGTYDPLNYPADGDDQIKAAIVAWASGHFQIGRDVGAGGILRQVLGVSGVNDSCPLPFIGFSSNPSTSTALAITARQHALFDTSRIAVTLTSSAP